MFFTSATLSAHISLPKAVLWIFQQLERQGFCAYVVGGCVRDALLGKVPHDWDFCTDATPPEILACFPGIPVSTAGQKHGTIAVILNRIPYEITTFRTEGTYTDGRHPDGVQFVRNLDADLSRRDFTINAMAYHPKVGLIDRFGGEADLQAKILRCVGVPERRFSEDALRILRGLRLAAMHSLTPEPETAAAMHQCAPLLHCISNERTGAELHRFWNGEGTRVVPLLVQFFPLWKSVLPELEQAPCFEEQFPRERTLEILQVLPPDAALRWAAFLRPWGEEIAQAVLTRLRLQKRQMVQILSLIRCTVQPVSADRIFLRRMAAQIGEETAWQLQILLQADTRQAEAAAQLRALLRQEGCFSRKKLAIHGRELLALGMPPGRAVGALWEQLYTMVLEEQLPNEREALLQAAKMRIQTENFFS